MESKDPKKLKSQAFASHPELDSGSKKYWYFLTHHHFVEILKSIS